MVQVGYTMMCEQAGPRRLVDDVVAAEAAGFDFAVISDHYFPWLDAQGHSPYAWSVLGAAAWATSTIPLMTYVTCPTFRYHPAVVAQKAATVQLLSEGRFTLGLGAGENLNEHIVGGGWPSVDVRHAMLREAVQIIRELWAGGYVNFDGEHFEVRSAKVWDLPPEPPEIGIAVSGAQSTALAGELADAMIAVEPDADLSASFDAAGGVGKPRIGQLAVSYDPDAVAAVARAKEQFRWFAAGWKSTASCRGRRRSTRPASSCGTTTSISRSRAGPTSTRSWTQWGSSPAALHRVGAEGSADGAARAVISHRRRCQ